MGFMSKFSGITKAVFGLGNPGQQYVNTRHNVGFRVIDHLQDGCSINEDRTLLFKPQDYMNLSGRAVQKIVNQSQMGLENILVICDDVHLPLGTIRVKAGGSHGGQKGLGSVITELGSMDVPRLRIGVGPVNPSEDLSDFVLGQFKPQEVAVLKDVIARSAEAVVMWVDEGLEKTMNQFNHTESGKKE